MLCRISFNHYISLIASIIYGSTGDTPPIIKKLLATSHLSDEDFNRFFHRMEQEMYKRGMIKNDPDSIYVTEGETIRVLAQFADMVKMYYLEPQKTSHL